MRKRKEKEYELILQGLLRREADALASESFGFKSLAVGPWKANTYMYALSL